VQLFCKKKSTGVQSFMLSLVNNNCPDLQFNPDESRVENRVRLSLVTLVVPVEAGQLRFEEQFRAVTREISTTGLSIILDVPRGLDEMILAFRRQESMSYVRGRSKHLTPMGAGFFRLGIELAEMVHPSDYPGLANVVF